MCRIYEDPRALESELARAKRALAELLGSYAVIDEDEVTDLKQEIADLEERVNQAWQDEEYDLEVTE